MTVKTRTAGVWGVTALLATSALIVGATELRHVQTPTGHTHVPWLFVAAAFYLAESNVVHVYRKGDAHTFSLSEVPLVVGLFFLTPTALVVAYLVGAGTALVVHRHQRPTKLCFNLAQFALAAVLADVVFHGLLPHATHALHAATATPHDVGTGTWLPLAAAALISALVGAVAVQTVIAISQGRRPRSDINEVAVLGGVAAIVNASLGIVAVSLAWDHPANTWALAVPLAIVVVAYRAYLAEREKRTGLQFLYESAHLLQGTPDVGEATAQLLAQTRIMFRAQWAELVLFPGGDGSRALRASVDADGSVHPLRQAGHLDPADLVLASLASDRQGLLVLGGRPTRTRRFPHNRTPVDGMVATLDSERGPIGMLRVHHRLDAVSSFNNEELRLLQTLANHVGTALANGQLQQSLAELRAQERELRQQALHDPLTGLANRSLFAERLREAIAVEHEREHDATAVVFIDLDDFKSVNDTFGHPTGDEVLRATAARIRDCLRPSDTAARLGGDEFAVLLPDVPDGSGALAVAQRIREAVEAPVAAGNHVVVVGASLGVSLGTAESVRIEDMLERADAAMYRVKAAGKGNVQLVETGAALHS